ncbi:MAG: hypothetical protein JNL12_17105 [Planctomycetes bacterium]|nr:hypothetical protein [Planctomycetota bacterium]
MSSFPRALQRLALALVVLATAVRLVLPGWHDATCRHQHPPATMAGAANASEAASCACATDPDAKQPWWTNGGERGEGRGDDGGGEPNHTAAFEHTHCLACELSHVPPGPPALPVVVAIPDFDDKPAAARPDEEPRPAAGTTTPPSRAPPHRCVAA